MNRDKGENGRNDRSPGIGITVGGAVNRRKRGGS
jgi:hypothetical protein